MMVPGVHRVREISSRQVIVLSVNETLFGVLLIKVIGGEPPCNCLTVRRSLAVTEAWRDFPNCSTFPTFQGNEGSLGLSGGFTPCRHLRPSSARART